MAKQVAPWEQGGMMTYCKCGQCSDCQDRKSSEDEKKRKAKEARDAKRSSRGIGGVKLPLASGKQGADAVGAASEAVMNEERFRRGELYLTQIEYDSWKNQAILPNLKKLEDYYKDALTVPAKYEVKENPEFECLEVYLNGKFVVDIGVEKNRSSTGEILIRNDDDVFPTLSDATGFILYHSEDAIREKALGKKDRHLDVDIGMSTDDWELTTGKTRAGSERDKKKQAEVDNELEKAI